MSKSKIRHIETYSPKNILTNDMISEELPSRSSKNIESQLGIKSRYIVDNNETAFEFHEYYQRKKIR
tara:strand:+ start:218 stop:418 length:201 start_codon:yes stop_codon:yes gene_type:complete